MKGEINDEEKEILKEHPPQPHFLHKKDQESYNSKMKEEDAYEKEE